MNKQSKEELVAEFAEKLKVAKAAFLADYRGLDVDQANDLRNKLREVGVEYRVVKNTLAKPKSLSARLLRRLRPAMRPAKHVN